MTYTVQQIRAFEAWERAMLALHLDEDHGIFHSPPPKPEGYDLWRQGEDPLKLEVTQPIPCAGGSLVDPDKLSDAKPIPLPAERLEQPPLL